MTPIGQRQKQSRRRILIPLLGLLGLLLIGATVALALRVRWAANPVATATPSPPLTTPEVTAVTPAPVFNPTLLDLRSSVSVTLAAGWQTMLLDAGGLRQRVGAIGDSTGQTLFSAVGDEATALVAHWEDAALDESLPSLTVIVVQRNELSLNRYLDEVRTGLQAHGATVHQSALAVGLRQDRQPVGVLHYTLSNSVAGSPLDGYQVIAYDATATQLVVFTFTTPSARYAEMLPRFEEAVWSADF